MEVIISGRHIEVDEGIKAYATDKMQKLATEYPKLTTARVVLELERNWRLVEAHVNGKHLNLNAKAKSTDFHISIDPAADKLEKQLRKYLERIQEHRVQRKPEDETSPQDEDEPTEE